MTQVIDMKDVNNTAAKNVKRTLAKTTHTISPVLVTHIEAFCMEEAVVYQQCLADDLKMHAVHAHVAKFKLTSPAYKKLVLDLIEDQFGIKAFDVIQQEQFYDAIEKIAMPISKANLDIIKTIDKTFPEFREKVTTIEWLNRALMQLFTRLSFEMKNM